ncbi:MAG: hypothetical protein CMJ18_15080 [Phycisphaeraceae bacterium]|nr:hypothetical protein [Phycisphaeraceae bacterium]
MALTPTAGLAAGSDTADLIREAQQYDIEAFTPFVRRDRVLALDLYRKALDSQPDVTQRIHILHRMAELNSNPYLLGPDGTPDYDTALEHLEQLVEIAPSGDPRSLRAMTLTATIHERRNDIPSAIRTWRRIVDFNPRTIEAPASDDHRLAPAYRDAMAQIASIQSAALDALAAAAERFEPSVKARELQRIVDAGSNDRMVSQAQAILDRLPNAERAWTLPPEFDDAPVAEKPAKTVAPMGRVQKEPIDQQAAAPPEAGITNRVLTALLGVALVIMLVLTIRRSVRRT